MLVHSIAFWSCRALYFVVVEVLYLTLSRAAFHESENESTIYAVITLQHVCTPVSAALAGWQLVALVATATTTQDADITTEHATIDGILHGQICFAWVMAFQGRLCSTRYILAGILQDCTDNYLQVLTHVSASADAVKLPQNLVYAFYLYCFCSHTKSGR